MKEFLKCWALGLLIFAAIAGGCALLYWILKCHPIAIIFIFGALVLFWCVCLAGSIINDPTKNQSHII